MASSRPRVTFRMHPRHRWCCGVVHSRMREAFRLRRWCSVLAWSASQCYSITLVVLCVVLGCVFPLCSPLFVCLEYSVFALSLLPCPPVILVHLNPSCKKAAKPYRQMNIIQVVEGLPSSPGENSKKKMAGYDAAIFMFVWLSLVRKYSLRSIM